MLLKDAIIRRARSTASRWLVFLRVEVSWRPCFVAWHRPLHGASPDYGRAHSFSASSLGYSGVLRSPVLDLVFEEVEASRLRSMSERIQRCREAFKDQSGCGHLTWDLERGFPLDQDEDLSTFMRDQSTEDLG